MSLKSHIFNFASFFSEIFSRKFLTSNGNHRSSAENFCPYIFTYIFNLFLSVGLDHWKATWRYQWKVWILESLSYFIKIDFNRELTVNIFGSVLHRPRNPKCLKLKQLCLVPYHSRTFKNVNQTKKFMSSRQYFTEMYCTFSSALDL